VPPGDYTVEDVFVYSDLAGLPDGEQRYVARSQAVTVDLEEPEDDKKLSWRLRWEARDRRRRLPP
jgi:hypothetical protein